MSCVWNEMNRKVSDLENTITSHKITRTLASENKNQVEKMNSVEN